MRPLFVAFPILSLLYPLPHFIQLLNNVSAKYPCLRVCPLGGTKLRYPISKMKLPNRAQPCGYASLSFLLDIPNVDVGVHRAGNEEIRFKHCPVQVAGNTETNRTMKREKIQSLVPKQ